MLLQREVDDVDIATSATPEEALELFPSGKKVGMAFGVVNVPGDGHIFEVATFREERRYDDGRHPEYVKFTDSPETDALRRDFTVNAIFYDPLKDATLDFVSGRSDLQKGILRAVGDPEKRFAEDHLRILRAVRFASRLSFQLDRATADAMSRCAAGLRKLAPERIAAELDKILAGSDPGSAFRTMHRMKILQEILLEISAMDGVVQPEQFHPEGDVLTHTFLMLDRMAVRDPELGWTILLHDTGKPSTISIDENGIPHFYGHESESAGIAEKVCMRLRFSRKRTERIIQAVGTHMRYAHVKQMRPAKTRRLISDPGFPLEIELHRTDCVASHGKTDNYIFLLDEVGEEENRVELPPPFLNGRDLIEAGLEPGPLFSEILGRAMDLQLEAQLKNRKHALEWLRENYP